MTQGQKTGKQDCLHVWKNHVTGYVSDFESFNQLAFLIENENVAQIWGSRSLDRQNSRCRQLMPLRSLGKLLMTIWFPNRSNFARYVVVT